MTNRFHIARKGVGCRHEMPEDENITLCGYAEFKFGKLYKCTAEKKCWLDIKITKPYIDNKHCPNCSKPNITSDLLINKDKHSAKCLKCGYEVTCLNKI